MEKFNAIKILEQELKEKELFDKNLGKEHYMKSVYKFMDNYMTPILDKKINENEMINNIKNDLEKRIVIKQIHKEATFMINDLGLVDKLDNHLNLIECDNGTIFHYLNKDEINFLNKDNKTKKKVANKLSDILLAMIEDYINDNMDLH